MNVDNPGAAMRQLGIRDELLLEQPADQPGRHNRDTAGPSLTSTLTTDPVLAAELTRLAALPIADYQTCRKAQARQLRITTEALDQFVVALRDASGGQNDRLAQRDLLIQLAERQGAGFWSDPAGEAYVSVVDRGRRKHFRIRSTECRNWLTRLYRDYSKAARGITSAPSGQAVTDAIGALQAEALDGPVYPVFVRIGFHDGKVYIDLGDETRRAIEICADGWRIVDDPPVRFTRPSGLLALPEPVRDENGLRALLSLLPDGPDAKDAKILLLTFLVGTFLPTGAMPLMAISGRQGSGKTTIVNRIRALIDPNKAPARQQPRSEDDLIIAAANGALVAYDNLSKITPELSDALCRLATGSGFSKRKLYTDGDEFLVEVRRPVLINGIVDLVRMPDLADRALFVELAPRSTYTPMSDLKTAFERNRPAMLGALYDAVAAALRGCTHEAASPGIRMVDLERFARAAPPAFDLHGEEVSQALKANRDTGDRMLIEDDLTATLLVKVLDQKGAFQGISSELLTELRRLAEPSEVSLLPKSPRGLSAHLRRFTQPFERFGITLRQERGTGSERERLWIITRAAPAKPHLRLVEEF